MWTHVQAWSMALLGFVALNFPPPNINITSLHTATRKGLDISCHAPAAWRAASIPSTQLSSPALYKKSVIRRGIFLPPRLPPHKSTAIRDCAFTRLNQLKSLVCSPHSFGTRIHLATYYIADHPNAQPQTPTSTNLTSSCRARPLDT